MGPWSDGMWDVGCNARAPVLQCHPRVHSAVNTALLCHPQHFGDTQRAIPMGCRCRDAGDASGRRNHRARICRQPLAAETFQSGIVLR